VECKTWEEKIPSNGFDDDVHATTPPDAIFHRFFNLEQWLSEVEKRTATAPKTCAYSSS